MWQWARGSSYSMVGTNLMDEAQLKVFGRARGSDMVAV